MKQSPLRDLAKANAKGVLDEKKYREDRAVFIESVLSGERVLQDNDYPPPVSTKTFEDLTDRSRATIDKVAETVKQEVQSEPTRSKNGLIAAGIAGVDTIVVILIIALSSDSDENSVNVTVTSTSNQPAVSTASVVGQNLIREFLGNKSWSQSSMDSFLYNWQALPETEKTSMKNSIELGQITNAIYKKLLEERALSGIGNPETSLGKQRQLVLFSNQIGIDDSRISIPEIPMRDLNEDSDMPLENDVGGNNTFSPSQ